MTPTQRSGILLLVIAAAGYACLPIFTKFAYEADIAPLDLATWRFIIATPAIWLLLLASGQLRTLRPLPRGRLLGVGALFAVAGLCAVLSLERIDASLYTVLIYTYPAMVAVILLALGEPLSRIGWIALALTLTGVVLTVPNATNLIGGADSVGMVIALVNAVAYAVYIVISSRLLRGQTALAGASALSISGTLLVMLAIALARGLTAPTSTQGWAVIIGLGIVSTVLPTFAFYAGMQRVGAGRAAIISTIEPVLVLILSFLLLGERLQGIQIVGGALILTSAVLLQLPTRKLRTAKPVSGTT